MPQTTPRAPAAAPASPAQPPLLSVRDIAVAYGRHAPAVRGLSFELPADTIACLLGPSGCGKTTVLRAIAGFVPLAGGQIAVSGEIVSGRGTMRPPEARGVGVVFQDYALFPHLTIADNIAFGLNRWSAADRRARVAEMLALVGLAAQAKRYPHELSGGQQQRVALGRALAPRPALVLMDEPFSNLDVDLRERLSAEVREILKASRTGAVLVTHDQHEAFAMADEIGVIHDGRIDQWDRPDNLYHRPASRFTADFVGAGVFLRGRVHAGAGGARSIDFVLGRLAADAGACGRLPDGQAVDVLLRPDDVVTRRHRADHRHRGAQAVPRRRVPLHAAPRLGRGRALAGAEPPQPCCRRAHRRAAGTRPRGRLPGRLSRRGRRPPRRYVRPRRRLTRPAPGGRESFSFVPTLLESCSLPGRRAAPSHPRPLLRPAPQRKIFHDELFRLVSIAAALVSGLCALPAAAQENVLNLYSARHYQTDEALYANFTKATGIRINRIEAGDEALLARLPTRAPTARPTWCCWSTRRAWPRRRPPACSSRCSRSCSRSASPPTCAPPTARGTASRPARASSCTTRPR